ncbi:hypothetical protein ACFXJJ_26165, partial [Streptomyces sp. NPDC059233]
ALRLHRGGGVAAGAFDSRPAVLGVLGRGATVGPARLLLGGGIATALAGLGRPLAVPLESSLH